METVKRLTLLLLVWTTLSSTMGCSSAPKKGSDSTDEVSSSDSSGVEAEEVTPDEQVVEENKQAPIVLVLGPGLARGFAYAGILIALKEKGIPVGAVIGTEMGALVGAIYATKSSVNDLEWSLMKLNRDTFIPGRLSLSKLFGQESRPREMEEILNKIFGNNSFNQTKIPLKVAIATDRNNDFFVLENGVIKDAVSASLGEQGGVIPEKLEGVLTRSSGFERPFPVDEARKLGIGPVVVVDVLEDFAVGKKASGMPDTNQTYIDRMKHGMNAARTELNQADLILKPNLKGIGYFDFDKKSIAVFRGKDSVLANIAELKRLTGQPLEDEEQDK